MICFILWNINSRSMTHNLLYLKTHFTEGSTHCPCQLQNESYNVVWGRVTVCSKMHAKKYAGFAECRIINVVIVGA